MFDIFSASGFLVHRPCGARKSGMPESVEMPAPVSATILRAAPIQPRTAAIVASCSRIAGTIGCQRAMSTGSLLRWIALVAGAELAVRGHLANLGWTCHAGAAPVAIALAALADLAREIPKPPLLL